MQIVKRSVACVDAKNAATVNTGSFQNTNDAKLVLLVNLEGYETRTCPDQRTLAEVNILHRHYPERLSDVFLINSLQTPFRKFSGKLLALLIAEMQDKMTFCTTGVDRERFNKNFDMAQVESRAGGEEDVSFDSQFF